MNYPLRLIRYSLLIVLITVAACAQTTTTSSTGETVDVSIDEVFTEADRTGPGGAQKQTEGKAAIPGIDAASFQEFADYQAWQRARQPGTPEFYEFQLWLQYLEYIRINNL